MTETVIPQLFAHGANAMPGHIGLYPGHPDNPYSSMGLWYYVPVFPAGLTPGVNIPVNRATPYFGLSNPQDYLNDLAQFGPLLHGNGSPVFFENQPMQQALPASGAISMNQINALFGRGNNLAAYRGTTWYTDANQSGTFPTGAIGLHDFYGKRPNSPVTPGAWDMGTPGYHDFYTPMHNSIGIQRMGGGGGAGGAGYGGDGGQTWAFVGGSPANGGQGGGYYYTDNFSVFNHTNGRPGAGGSWGAGGNSNNIAGQAGTQVSGAGQYLYNTGKGGDSAWGSGGASRQLQTVYSVIQPGNGGGTGAGGGGGTDGTSNAVIYVGDGGGGAGYTYDVFGAGVIGGVVNVYCAPAGGGAQGGGAGGNGRIYVNWS